jgi:autotransporter strand-loop-strand O-heptosyltransferase
MKKIIIVAPHLSTGGLPQYIVRQIEAMRGEYLIWCVEWDSITGGVLVVQRNKIQRILGDGLITLHEDKYEFLRLIDSVEPDIIHFQEVPETFMSPDILTAVWHESRNYDIVVTTHSSNTDPSKLRFVADRYVLVSEWSRRRFASEFGDEVCSVWDYPVESRIYDKQTAKSRIGFEDGKVHILHVGLFTPGKNQSFLMNVARLMVDLPVHFHFVGNQAGNFIEYWEPLMNNLPGNCTWHGERSDVENFYMAADIFTFPSLFELNPLSLKEARGYGLPLVIRRLDTYDGEYDEIANFIGDNPEEAVLVFEKVVAEVMSGGTKQNIYQGLIRSGKYRSVEPTITMNFISGPYVHISGTPGDVYDVTFTDAKTGFVHYRVDIGNDCWAKANVEYVVDWLIRFVRKSDGIVFERRFEPQGKKVFVALDSKSVGDTLAWFPQVERFRKIWECDVVCSTFMNDQFIDNYPEITFVEPGSVVHGIYGMYSIGWFFGEDGHNTRRHPRDFRKFSLCQTASDILGIEYELERATIPTRGVEKKKRVGFGIHSTAQTKYWNNPTGWQELTNFFTIMGYEVVIYSNEGDGYMGNGYPIGATVNPAGDIESLKDAMMSCEIFVGIGSGLSWLAWTLRIPTVLISGFSTPVSEFEGDDVIRIFNPEVCNGCYNRYRFNPGDWNWCPDHKETDRQFECTKSITGSMVVSKILEKGWVSFYK